jgi:hypothetical protein
MSICPKCNCDLDNSTQFCINCGEKISAIKKDKEVKKGYVTHEKPGKKSSSIANIGLIFGIVVICFAWFAMFIYPMFECYKAKSWVQTPCRIIGSSVITNHTSDEDTYKIMITFSYEFNNVKYTSKRYDFFNFDFNSYSSAENFIKFYPPGKETICYVDPANPDEAVLDRDYRSSSYVFLVITIIFIIYFPIRWLTGKSRK